MNSLHSGVDESSKRMTETRTGVYFSVSSYIAISPQTQTKLLYLHCYYSRNRCCHFIIVHPRWLHAECGNSLHLKCCSVQHRLKLLVWKLRKRFIGATTRSLYFLQVFSSLPPEAACQKMCDMGQHFAQIVFLLKRYSMMIMIRWLLRGRTDSAVKEVPGFMSEMYQTVFTGAWLEWVTV